MWWKQAKNGRKSVKVGENTNKPYPECERSIKIPVVNNAHGITKYGVLGRLDVQIVVLSAAPKRSPVGHGSKKMPGALTLPQGSASEDGRALC